VTGPYELAPASSWVGRLTIQTTNGLRVGDAVGDAVGVLDVGDWVGSLTVGIAVG